MRVVSVEVRWHDYRKFKGGYFWEGRVGWRDRGLVRQCRVEHVRLPEVARLVARIVCAVEADDITHLPGHCWVAEEDQNGGYWATHDYEGGGYPGAIPMCNGHPARIVAGIDHETYEGTVPRAYIRRPILGEW